MNLNGRRRVFTEFKGYANDFDTSDSFVNALTMKYFNLFSRAV